MSIPNELKLIEIILQKFQYQPSPIGLLRIAGWTCLFLILISIMLTMQRVEPKSQLITMNTGTNDLQWVRNDFDLFPKDNHFNVAWVSGSSIILGNGKEIEYLPQKVNKLMSTEEDILTRAFVYSMNARRLLDTYTMVQDALARQPDALVLVINPFWVFNSNAIFYKQNLFNQGAKLWWNTSDWLWQFILTAPTNHLYNLVGQYIPVITARRHYIKQLTEKSRDLLGVSVIPNPVKSANNHVKETFKVSQPLQFWLMHQVFNGQFQNGRMDVYTWQKAAISQADTTLSSWPVEIMHQMINKINDSEVPTLLYVAPVSPKMEGMGSQDGYNKVLNSMQTLKNQYENDTLRIIVRLPKHITDSIAYKDFLHLKVPGKLPEFLSKQLAELVRLK